MATGKLTDTAIRSAKPRSKSYRLSDGAICEFACDKKAGTILLIN